VEESVSSTTCPGARAPRRRVTAPRRAGGRARGRAGVVYLLVIHRPRCASALRARRAASLVAGAQQRGPPRGGREAPAEDPARNTLGRNALVRAPGRSQRPRIGTPHLRHCTPRASASREAPADPQTLSLAAQERGRGPPSRTNWIRLVGRPRAGLERGHAPNRVSPRGSRGPCASRLSSTAADAGRPRGAAAAGRRPRDAARRASAPPASCIDAFSALTAMYADELPLPDPRAPPALASPPRGSVGGGSGSDSERRAGEGGSDRGDLDETHGVSD